MKTMMNQKLLMTIAASCFLAACGEYSKEPVADLQQLRADAKNQYEHGGPKVPEVVYRDRDVIHEKEVPVLVGGYSSDDISINTYQTYLNFTQGVERKHKVAISSSRPGVEVELEVKDLPSGASFKKVKTGQYELTWSPSYSSIENDQPVQVYVVTFVGKVTKANSAQEESILRGFIKEEKMNLIVFRNTTKAGEVK